MRIAGRVAARVLLIVGAWTVVSEAEAAVSCHKINTKGVGQALSPTTTVAKILGGGLLHGTTEGNFVNSGAPPVFSFTGTIEFTTNKGTLTIGVVGTLNVSTGEFTAAGPVSDATGKLAGATGALTFDGLVNFSDTPPSFVEDITGIICADLAP